MSVHRPLSSEELRSSLRDARKRTLELVEDLSDEQLGVPELEHVNPFLWELGHVAYFWEAFVLRELGDTEILVRNGDTFFDSFRVEHTTRWQLEYASRDDTLKVLKQVSGRVLERLDERASDERTTYLTLLAVLHEDMHGEAFTYTRQTLGYAAPEPYRDDETSLSQPGGGPHPGDVTIPGGRYCLGAKDDATFVFDNEKGAEEVDVAAFRIARAPVTNAEFTAFIADDGYARQELWRPEGWAWLTREKREVPLHWERTPSGWLRKHFDNPVPIDDHHPVVHVSWHEAQAWCNWAGRRLPSEIEWEMAASAQPGPDGSLSPDKRCHPWGSAPVSGLHANLDARRIGCVDVSAFADGDSAFGCRQMLGNVWEWTASEFQPYPGFQIDPPYREYSAPWFGGRKVLRGGAWATRSRLACNAYRNFFLPHRADIFAGFRTCAR